MNPYAKILSLLEALPDEERLLVSMARRQKVGEKECGCLFGTLLTKSGFLQTAGDPSDSFRNETDLSSSDISRWGRATLNLDADDLYALVSRLERLNDGYATDENDPWTCRDRYRHVCARLSQISDDYEEDNERNPE